MLDFVGTCLAVLFWSATAVCFGVAVVLTVLGMALASIGVWLYGPRDEDHNRRPNQ